MRKSWLPYPVASLADVEDKPEGSLDPLGTYAIADALATNLASAGVRERQSNLRFLTLCSVGWSLIGNLDQEGERADPSLMPEQAFEWLVVDALVRKAREGAIEMPSIPGRLKAEDCLKRGMPLNADRYLRTPRTFGFFGVYRTLAAHLGMVSDASDSTPLLGGRGVALLEAWRSDRKLPGFGPGLSGDGSAEFKKCRDRLQASWTAGELRRDGAVIDFLVAHLNPDVQPGPRERDALGRLLREGGDPRENRNLRFVLASLEDAEFMAGVARGDDRAWEPGFHCALRARAGSEGEWGTVEGIDAVVGYERFIGPLARAFDGLRARLSACPTMVRLDELAADMPELADAAEELPARYAEAAKALAPVLPAAQFADRFERFSSPLEPAALAAGLVEHHEAVQRRKPPEGKAPWFGRDGGRIAIRPLYRLESRPEAGAAYQHQYRSVALRNFLVSIGAIDGQA